MKLRLLPPAKALHPAHRVQHVERSRLELFNRELGRLLNALQHSANESEEHLKNLAADFLKDAFYKQQHFINTKDKQDLVVHHGPKPSDPVGVIIETKKPGNKAEMISPAKPNTKALHELLRYYLNERLGAGNKEVRRLVITNIHEWYVFDAADFEKHVYQNKTLTQQYADWREGRLGVGDTGWFYREIAAPFFEHELPELACCYVNLTDYTEAAFNDDPSDDESLLDLYKAFSPEFLLKKPFANDSNALNKPFYDELLYILGLEEMKTDGTKRIQRAGKRRQEGSLLENTLGELEVSGAWRDAPELTQFGDTPEEQQFSIALELCITWLNRILFLKLLEAQLQRWQDHSAADARFLRPDKVRDFDEINELFFHVLAVPEDQRRDSVRQKFGDIPYLNSSLFEQTELERRTLRVSALKDRLEMPLASSTVLRDNAGKRRTGTLSTLHYLYAFLDAYDFSSDARARIQADHRDVINASVLGLIFEKINGYRDGSFYTPGFITMYMCRETLRRAVLQKFNDRYGWDSPDFDSLHNRLDFGKTAEYNELVNSLRVCDPAVGSGHFLVSALNELIALKSELGILCDRQGRRLRELSAVVGNDELIFTDTETDQPIGYRPGVRESQRLQEALFHEKQTLIENCLFGVDINPKSVMICRLRLWIELLKHAYFTADSRYTRLETLPNIDINIKSGNSLISRFALDEDLSEVFRRQKFSRQDYLLAVQAYKTARRTEDKEELRAFIRKIKDEFRQAVFNRNPFAKQLSQKRGQLVLLDNNLDLFGEAKKDAATVEKERARLQVDIAELEQRLEDYKSGPLYRNSFEWRFEFPEVLDEAGRYSGFDVVVGNPPYIRQEALTPFKSHFQSAFSTFAGTADLYVYFVERGMHILRPGGQFSYILPNKWMRAGYGDKLRQFVKRHRIEGIHDFGDLPVFEEATTYPCILELSRQDAASSFTATSISTLAFDSGLSDYLREHAFTVGLGGLQDGGWTLTDTQVQALLDKLRAAGKPLGEYVEGKIYYGIKTGLNEAFVIDAATRARLIAEDPRSAEVIKPFLAGRDIKRYQTPGSDRYLILFEKGITNQKRGSQAPDEWLKYRYPAIYNILQPFEEKAKARYDKGEYWWELRACDYYSSFAHKKIMFPDIAIKMESTLDTNQSFCANTAYFIDSESEYLLGLLNSTLFHFFYCSIVNSIRGGYLRFFTQYLGRMPIVEGHESVSNSITTLVTQILTLKRSDPTANTSALEAEVDGLVYGLYGLTEAEVGLIEGAKQ